MRGRRRALISAAAVLLSILVTHTAWCAASVKEFADCRQMGIDLRWQLPRHLEQPLRRSLWLNCLRDVFGYRWTSTNESADLSPKEAMLIAFASNSPQSHLRNLAARDGVIGPQEAITSMAWASGVRSATVSEWLSSSCMGALAAPGTRLSTRDGLALLLTAMHNTPMVSDEDPVDAVKGFYAALGRAVASPAAADQRQLQRWCCGDALARLASNLTALGADAAFHLVSMRVVAVTRAGHLATVSVVRTADQRLAGSTSRSTAKDQFCLRLTNQGWRIYR